MSETETTEAETTKTTATAVMTTTVTTTVAAEITTETATESRTFAHHYEIMNTAFKTRPVNEKCLGIYASDPDRLPENVRKAIEENREVYGSVKKWCVDEDNNCIYARVHYGLKRSYAKDLAIYRIDMNSGEAFWCCDTAGPDEDVTGPFVPEDGFGDVFTFQIIGGKLIYEPFSGLYYVDEESHSLVVIEPPCNTQAKTISLIDDKLYIHSCNTKDGQEDILNEVYDPKNDTLTPFDDFSKLDPSTYINNSWIDWFDNSNLIYEGETGDEHKIIFEWD